MKLSSWGRLSSEEYAVGQLGREVPASVPNAGSTQSLVYGMGRSYGDACLNPGGFTWLSRHLDRFISFDAENGVLTCEAGVTLGQIQTLFAPRGWMLQVTPGTQYVSVGGAIANDVHGKNHHSAGCFGNHVMAFVLERTDGQVLTCSPSEHSGLYRATIGGLGLTGIVRQATLQLRRTHSPWLDTETLPYTSLSQFFALSDESEEDWEYTVSWIDCSKAHATRGIFIRANHADSDGTPRNASGRLRVPFSPPFSLVNRYSLAAFNQAYFANQCRQAGQRKEHYSRYFYPLDGILDWNKFYGRRGFYQYQLVVPRQDGEPVVTSLLKEIASSGMGSFLSVLKTFGDRPSPGMLSFPMPGVTLALDFPNRGERLESLFQRLDKIVLEAGGRLYPAKDARMSQSMFNQNYPDLAEFIQFRDPGMSSAMSRRLLGS